MLLHILHRTTYTYDRPVFLEPHLVRLRPRSDVYQRLLQWNITLDPEPAGQSAIIDAQGADVTRIWFESSHTVFQLETTSVVETLCTNPYAFLLEPEAQRIPLQLSSLEKRLLGPCLGNEALSKADKSAAAKLAQKLVARSDRQSVPFLSALCAELYGAVETVVRDEPGTQSVASTLQTSRGACRDTALVFMACCREMGIPARFVSGYQQGDPDSEQRELHAWAEVYLPGGGWRGFDPTLGLAVTDGHVALAASAEPEGAAPLSGSFRGTGVRSRLDHHIRINASESAD